jgi:hypothetical protein
MALQIEDDLSFHRATWRAERIGWCVMSLIVIGGFVGVLGLGPLGRAASGDDALIVRYDRIMRRSAPGEIAIRIGRSQLTAPFTHVWVGRELFHGCHPSEITPRPERTTDDGARLWFSIRTMPDADSGQVIFACEPDEVGRHAGAIGVAAGPARIVRIVVLP